MERNWAGNHEYAGARLERPASLDELAEVVGVAPRVRAIGSRHSFTDIVDSDVNGEFLWIDDPLQPPIPSWGEVDARRPWNEGEAQAE